MRLGSADGQRIMEFRAGTVSLLERVAVPPLVFTGTFRLTGRR